MTTLHQISTSQPGQTKHILSLISTQDTVLLLGDACYQLPQWITALIDNPIDNSIDNHSQNQHNIRTPIRLCVRQHDLDQRGLTATASATLTLLTDAEWVSLTLAHHPVVSWK